MNEIEQIHNENAFTVPEDETLDVKPDFPRVGDLDEGGTPFDPVLHTGTLTAARKWRKRRKPKAETKPAIDVHENQEEMLLGALAANTLIQLGIVIGGEAWQPQKVGGYDEAKNLELAFTRYFEAKEITDIPPGIALSIAIGSYAAPRLASPEAKSKYKQAWDWAKNKFSKKKNETKTENRA